ncbi:MAG: D-tyrosyl-tRNA(Tyr) deacylase [Parachlamydiales bacterium]|nr:D-tyrosyl-tRNA(Tyr) deacylase [Parachlamydiales bacterium]
MRLVIQRVLKASVTVDQQIVGSINKGILAFLGIHAEDACPSVSYLIDKLIHLRIFSDDQGKMNRSLQDIKGEILVVSQFTLYANCSEGRRPSFTSAASFEKGKELYDRFVEDLRKIFPRVQTGIFGAAMQVALINDGPATFLIESK